MWIRPDQELSHSVKGFRGYIFNIPHINTSKLKYFKNNPNSLCFNTLMDLKTNQYATSPFFFFFFTEEGIFAGKQRSLCSDAS